MSERFDAWWLPGHPDDLATETIRVGDLECRYPVPTPRLLDGTVDALRTAGQSLARRPVQEIVASVDAAAARLADREDPLRRQADRVLAAAAGYSPEMTTLVLDRMTGDWSADATRRLLRDELQDPAVLDGFAPAGDGRRVRAYGPRLALHVFAGNVPGVAVTSLIRSLLVKAPSLGKLASGEPILPVLFARALDSVDADLARALAVTYWPGGSEDVEGRLLQAADLVVVYGGPDAEESYRRRVPPDHRLVLHGARFSVGLVGRDALAHDSDLPHRVARATAVFDQHGCVSPHALWVEDPSRRQSEAFAEALAAAFERLESELPRGRLEPDQAARIQQERGAAEMRGYSSAVRVLSSVGTAWTVVLDREPAFRASCLNRFLHVHPIDTLEEVSDLLVPVGHRLQSIAIAAPHDRRLALADRFARIGATRVTSFDRIPWPPPQWHHDGRGPLTELLRWVDFEE